ncbi:MAG: hypothetical protein M3296_07760 [Actinomycetota bacterium]|nr:hypothetical protein [Actinomycetota bacterium]
MATDTQSRKSANQDPEAVAERVRELNERIVESGRKAGNVYLDSYEKTMKSIADYQDKAAESTDVEWLRTVFNAQASFTRDVTDTYVAAARTFLK